MDSSLPRPSSPSFDAPAGPPASSPVTGQPPAPPSQETTRPDPRRAVDRRRRRAAWVGIPTLSLALGLGGGAIAGHLAGGASTSDAEIASLNGTTTAAESVSEVVLLSMDIPTIIGEVEESIVSISTEIDVRQGRFSTTAVGAGTGVAFDSAGYIITNAHVVEGASTITVTTNDGTELAATLVGADAAADIAVLQVAPNESLTVANFSTEVTTVGDPVLAIGNALALDGSMTVTQGIVSALDRSIDTTSGELTHLLQTDAAISSGNSGGPLVDAAGNVIGINTAVASSSGTTQASNIGFAITAERALEIAGGLLVDQG